MIDWRVILLGIVVITTVCFGPKFIKDFKQYLKAEEEKKKKEKEELSKSFKEFLTGSEPPDWLKQIGYQFWHHILDYQKNGTSSIYWPEFKEIGGGSKELYDEAVLFGSATFVGDKKLEYLAVVGYLGDIDEWYNTPLKKRIEVLREKLTEKNLIENIKLEGLSR